ncbi:MAG: arylsulfatase [Pirellulales bacterium]|nr:arylsulfatase [Pirellulales bacterium]
MTLGDAVANEPGESSRPNIIVILSDDQGWGDLSLNGNKDISTPHIDSLARDGAMFDRFYVCPVCSPTRADFLTGRHHARMGISGTSKGQERISLEETTIADSLKAAGYATAAFGKWHNGMQHPYHPNARGFDEFYGFCSGHWGNYFSPPLEHNGKLIKGDGFVIDDFTSRAIDYIKEHKDKPFFAYLAHNTPHSPMQVPDRWWQKFKGKKLSKLDRYSGKGNLDHTRAALAMCENIDWNVGRLLKALDDEKIADNTIVLYFCDNGPNGQRYNGDMRGRKGSTDEGGVRSPLHVRWPAKIKAGTKIPQIGAAIDLLPTLLDCTATKHIGKKPLDGVSLSALLLGQRVQWKDRVLISNWRGKVSARSQKYRLDHQGRLYDMHADPSQDKNVAKQHPMVAARLKQAIADWRKDVERSRSQTPRHFTVGHPDAVYTQLPARDAEPHGGIKRSNRHPNNTFMTAWRTTDDKITWDVDVLADGEFEVEVYYTCPKGDEGSTVELSLGDARTSAVVREPHDPPLTGAENDRSKRIESYVKDFRPMSLGRIKLKKGQGSLTLRALKVPGNQVMDMRLVMLRRRGD